MACSLVDSHELDDVWISIIGPMLNGVQVLKLSMVSKWGNRIAHSIYNHQDFVSLASNTEDSATLKDIFEHWPHLKFECKYMERDFTIHETKNSSSNDVTGPSSNPMKHIGKIRNLNFFGCKTATFEFLDANTITNLGLFGLSHSPLSLSFFLIILNANSKSICSSFFSFFFFFSLII